MSFGENLRRARKAAGLSQKDLALKVGAKHNSVSNWENDQNSPSNAMIGALCEVLGVEANDLFGTAPGPDDFTYALYNEAQELTPENQKKLLEMAKFFRQQQDADEL